MQIVSDIQTLSAGVDGADRPLGLVPTMGALHEGHLSLVRRAVEECATVVVSIFVNRLQFGPDEDFDAYPRNLEGDAAQLEQLGVDIVFAPDERFADDAEPVVVDAALTSVLEGASRPGHLDGVTTIVAHLLAVVRPDRAYFGEKDFQQLVVVRRMVADQGLGVDIVGMPVVRDSDGLALSSRNTYLTSSQRAEALAVVATLRAIAAAWDGDADTARVRLRRRLEDARGVRLDYAEIIDPETLEPLEGVVSGPAQAVVAVHVGGTRLIDTFRLEPVR